MAAGLKTIIALSFVWLSLPKYVLSRSNPLTGPRHRLSPSHPFFSAVSQLSTINRRRNLRYCTLTQLDMWKMRQSR